ncbi:MAG: hypothetical protein ACP5U2_02985 [Bryobacteraceae bacterium]
MDTGRAAGGEGGLSTTGEALQMLARRLVRRRWANVALAQGSWALSLGVAALIVLVAAGAQVVEGWWLAAWTVGTTAIALARVLGRRPRPYPLLQEVDRRLQLHDTLSTAFYFHSLNGSRALNEEARWTLFAQAGRLAGELDPRRAEPVRAPRSLWALAGLTVIASSLFAWRYGPTGRLDLRPPAAAAAWPGARAAGEESPKAEPAVVERIRRMLEGLGIGSQAGDNEARRVAQALAHEGSGGGELTPAPPRPDLSQPVPSSTAEEGSEVEQGEGLARASDGSAGDQAATGADSRQPWNNENSGLMEKFREALASLLSQLKSRPSHGNSQGLESGETGAESARSGRRGTEKGTPGPGRQSAAEGRQQADGDQEGEAAQSAQGASGKTSGPDTDVQPAREGRSGIGREDGRKDTALAEQQAAMGKLTELIGRRQATLTGEIMVEVSSGTQKLRTPYSDRQTAHADRGGEIHRDEVPLFLRDYVQRYFEEIRKAPAPSNAPQARQP